MPKFFDGEHKCPIDGEFKWHGYKISNGEIRVGREFVMINVNSICEREDGSFDIEIHCPNCGKRFIVNKKFEEA